MSRGPLSSEAPVNLCVIVQLIFIDHQAKIAMDPLFGDIQDIHTSMVEQENGKPIKSGLKRSSFAINVSMEKKRPDATAKQAEPFKATNAFKTLCLFSQKNHTLESYIKLKEKKRMVCKQ